MDCTSRIRRDSPSMKLSKVAALNCRLWKAVNQGVTLDHSLPWLYQFFILPLSGFCSCSSEQGKDQSRWGFLPTSLASLHEQLRHWRSWHGHYYTLIIGLDLLQILGHVHNKYIGSRNSHLLILEAKGLRDLEVVSGSTALQTAWFCSAKEERLFSYWFSNFRNIFKTAPTICSICG